MLTFDQWQGYIKTTKLGVGAGTLYSFYENDKNIAALKASASGNLETNNLNTREFCYSTRCFDYFWGNFNNTGKFYFCFPAVPAWYMKIVEEFNSSFKNLQIEIVEEYDRIFYEHSYMGEISNRIDYLKQENINNKAFTLLKKPIFLLRTNKENYRNEGTAISRISYAVHHFFRLISIPELYYISLLDEDPGENYLQFVLNLNNRIVEWRPQIKSNYLDLVYRSLSENIVNLEDFLFMDSSDVMKYMSGCVIPGRIKQTAILNTSQNRRLKEYSKKYFTYDLSKIPAKIAELGNDLIGFGKIDEIDSHNGKSWILFYNVLGETVSASLDIRNISNQIKILDITETEARNIIKKNTTVAKKDLRYYTGKKGSWKIYGITNEFALMRIVLESSNGTLVDVQDHIKSPGFKGSRVTIDRNYLEEITEKEWKQKVAYYKTLSIQKEN